MIQSPVCFPVFAEAVLRIVVRVLCGESYLIIVQNKAETPNDRFQGRKGICRISHTTEKSFGGGGCNGFRVLPSMTDGGVLLVFARGCSATIRVDRVICIDQSVVRESNLNA
jgi:hypothetical protein